MKQHYAYWPRLLSLLGLAATLATAPAATHAQTPAWTLATTGNPTGLDGESLIRATATDASGNVFVAGLFSGSIALGGTTLTSAGDRDIFLAKYVPGTGTWAWAASSGGIGEERLGGLAVSGANVYLTGSFLNNSSNANAVYAGGTGPAAGTVPIRGISTTAGFDIALLKYVDQGASATLGWVQVAGGTEADLGYGLAASGSSVYLTGVITNSLANANNVVFGGTASTPGTRVVRGTTTVVSADMVVAKYTDTGPTATVNWTQVSGGIRSDYGSSIAVSGPNVYVAGSFDNNLGNLYGVLFGSDGTTAGTVPQYGATPDISIDIILAKYTDNGNSATLGWTQVAGGKGTDTGNAVAVSGTSVYLTGSLINNSTNANEVVFGGSGTVPGTAPQYGASATSSRDMVLAKYTDNGSSATLGWTQVAGGNGSDEGNGLVASGTEVYLAASIENNASSAGGAVFGGSGTTAGTIPITNLNGGSSIDLVAAKYTDNGPSATLGWTRVGGGQGYDGSYSLALGGSSLYLGGWVGASATAPFGTATNSPVRGTLTQKAVLGQLEVATGTWQAVASSANGGPSTMRATATDASGNVFVTGNFSGELTLGTTTLASQGADDFFVAKYVPATSTWAWAVSGGGGSLDNAFGLAVSGSSVYVSGFLTNSLGNSSRVLLGSGTAGTNATTVFGASTNNSSDLLVAKYTDLGTSAALAWAQVAGGTAVDQGYGVAVSGPSVYVTGAIFNNTANANSVLFGGTGTTMGTATVRGASATAAQDLLVAKYTDNGPTATYNWAQVGGGTGADVGYGVAVRGPSVYATGFITDTRARANNTLFGGNGTAAGTTPVSGASSMALADIVLTKYTDNGATGTFEWAQVGGGTTNDYGNAVAVRDSSVYVTGSLINNTTDDRAAVFSSTGSATGYRTVRGATTSASLDLVLAKYVDKGTTARLAWTQVGGGTAADVGNALALNGPNVFVAGAITTTISNANGVVFGGNGTKPGTVPVPGASSNAAFDVLVAHYLDQDSTAVLNWTQVGGGMAADNAYGLALSRTGLYSTGQVLPVATFGSLPVPRPTTTTVGLLGGIAISGLLAVAPAAPTAGLSLYPNPGPATLSGASPGATVHVFDALGRRVATTVADARGTAALPGGLPAGLYLVRAGASTGRWVVE